MKRRIVGGLGLVAAVGVGFGMGRMTGSVTIPGVVDSVTAGVTRTTIITTHPLTDRPSVSLTLKEGGLTTQTFYANDNVTVTIEK